jgi:hypothetical protein
MVQPAQLSFFHDAAFCSFTLCIFHPTFNFYHAAFLFIPRTLFFRFLKWGGSVRATAMFRAASTFPFYFHIIFLLLSKPHHLLSFHNFLSSAE